MKNINWKTIFLISTLILVIILSFTLTLINPVAGENTLFYILTSEILVIVSMLLNKGENNE